MQFTEQQKLEMHDSYMKLQFEMGARDFAPELVHYTKTDVLRKILETNELWFGCIKDQNDQSEFDHMIGSIPKAIEATGLGHILRPIGIEITQAKEQLKSDTFVSCWCEYDRSRPNGTLSMWRAYGDNCHGIGLVIDSSQISPSNLKPDNLLFPVNAASMKYLDESQIPDEVKRTIEIVRSTADQRLLGSALPFVSRYTLIAQAPTIKHPDFYEEKEIRFLHTPHLVFDRSGLSETGTIRTAQINGKTRRFFCMNLKRFDQYGFDFSPPTILKKILVGPGDGREATAQEVRALLDSYGLHQVEVAISQTPVRST